MAEHIIIDNKIIKIIFNVILFVWVISIPFKNALFQISVVLMILIFFIYIIVNKDYTNFKIILYKYKDLLVITILIIFSMTMSNLINDIPNKDKWITEIKYLYRYIIIFMILIYFYSKNFFSDKLLIVFILIALSIQAFDGLYQSFFGNDLFKDKVGNIKIGLTGATSNRNTFSFFMGIGVVLSSIFIVRNIVYKKQIFLFLLLFCLFLYCTLFSYSRAIWVSLLIVCFLFIVINFRNIKLKYIIYILILIFLLSILFFNFNTLNTRFNLLMQGESSRRYEIWIYALKLIQQKLIFGWGLDSWKVVGLRGFTATHNSVLEILLYLGAFGLLVYSILVYVILREIYTYKQFELGYIFIFLLISSQFGQSITSGKVFISSLVIFMFYVFSRRIEKLI